jgi:hypothetical protein
MEYDARPATVLSGTCGSCGHQLTILQGGGDAPPDGSMPTPDATAGADAGTLHAWKATAPAVDGPPCQACGEPLAFRSGGGPNIEATCSGCGAVASYVPAGMAPREFQRREAPRFERSERSERPERSDDSGSGFRNANARPCRECGGALRFTTADDGTISGECGSCGNRFTLPPRRDFAGGGDRGGGRRFEQRGPPRGKFGGRGGSRPYGRPPGGGGGFRRREGGEDRDGDERPRRRPRRE